MAHVQYYIGYRCIIQRFKTFKVIFDLWASLVTQMVKNLPAMWETGVQSLGWEDPLEEGAPVFFAGESPWIEEPGGLQSMGSQRVGHD